MGSNFFDEILEDFLFFYGKEMMSLFFYNLLLLIIRYIMFYVLIQLVFTFFPPLKNVFRSLAFPFRVIHVFCHVNAAKAIDQKNGILSSDDTYKKSVSVMMWSSIKWSERSSIMLRSRTTREAYKIASAPQKFGLLVLVCTFFLTPLLSPLGPFFLFIHFYLLTATFGVAMPSSDDYFYVINTAMVNTDITPMYLYYGFPFFVLTTFLTYLESTDLIYAIVSGVAWIYIYYSLLIFFAARSFNKKVDIRFLEDDNVSKELFRRKKSQDNNLIEENALYSIIQ